MPVKFAAMSDRREKTDKLIFRLCPKKSWEQGRVLHKSNLLGGIW